jgi:hypothetical protein
MRDRCINNPVRNSNKTHFSAHTVIYAVMWTLIKMAVNILLGTNSRHSTVNDWRNKYQLTNMKGTVKIRWYTLISRFQIHLGNKLPDDIKRCAGNKIPCLFLMTLNLNAVTLQNVQVPTLFWSLPLPIPR